MEEFCLECWNQTHGTGLKKSQVILSAKDDMDVCCCCGKVGQVVVRVPAKTPLGWLECQYWTVIDKFGL